MKLSNVRFDHGLLNNLLSSHILRIINKMKKIAFNIIDVVEYDYNNTDGTISNHRVAVDVANFTSLTGKPDGMTIDIDDNLWIALYGGGAVIHANPRTGELLQVVALPARDVTSAMWGGPNLDILFVTTSRVSLTDEEKKYYPAAGGVFAIRHLHTKGLPVFNAKIIDSI
uniref:Regucalcin n=2 Tax=Rhynchophorus ferrugineus TaxID=354439 RepID=A0A834HNB4_RHYFE|nr:hypothetical protein GWI33_000318 [Rhynchophorus ferrugineus]